MGRREAARRPRGGAEARPDAKANIRSASRVIPTITRTGQSQDPTDITLSPAKAELVVSFVGWLHELRAWFDEQLDGTEGEIVALRRSDAERIRLGLTNCAACLDGIAVAPAEPQSPCDAPMDGAPLPTAPSSRTLQ